MTGDAQLSTDSGAQLRVEVVLTPDERSPIRAFLQRSEVRLDCER